MFKEKVLKVISFPAYLSVAGLLLFVANGTYDTQQIQQQQHMLLMYSKMVDAEMLPRTYCGSHQWFEVIHTYMYYIAWVLVHSNISSRLYSMVTTPFTMINSHPLLYHPFSAKQTFGGNSYGLLYMYMLLYYNYV